MNKGIRFTDEFKQDALVQVVERGYAVSEVAERQAKLIHQAWTDSGKVYGYRKADR
jgi:transposase-like protein